ncbi:hypothetical protein GCM10010377_73020 [Streptomyces viridiviolaceus]|uniref:Transcriptional regulator n=1 Tax=Streptomyces viridiviolaceus TaxID=68282 RepID=A0ABW2DYD7_9ACTN|nr:hypothetical protein [Streptomyces viridiviolaceus]GHB71917.1 hypothetical protein GCM10010377_73020 [Streptomyces viridiviolaceus]
MSDAVSSVPRAFGELLTPLSGWTMEEARTELGVDRARIAGAVHAFLQRGLIQHVTQEAGKKCSSRC